MSIPTAISVRMGQAHAATLSRIAGGRRLVVPSNAEKSAPLAALVGEEIAALLIFHFAGRILYVPTGKATGGGQSIDASEVDNLTIRGLSAAQIARQLNCSDRSVYRNRKLNSEKRAKRSSQAPETKG